MADRNDKQGTAEGATCSSKEADSTECTGNWGTIRWYEKPLLMVRDTGKATEGDLEKIEDYLKESNMKLRTQDMRDITTSPLKNDMIDHELVEDSTKLNIEHYNPGLTDDSKTVRDTFVLDQKMIMQLDENRPAFSPGRSVRILRKALNQTDAVWFRKTANGLTPDRRH